MQGSVGRGIRRRVRRAVTWRPTRAGTDPVDIAELIAPLRFDVVVRARFLDWLEPRLDDDPVATARQALDHEYAAWFRHIEVARFRPHLASDEVALRTAYGDRVGRTATLLRSYLVRGFDPSHPVTLRRTSSARTADSGLLVAKTLHVGDGAHRLALLLRDGLPLQPEMYVVEPRPMPVIDNTSVLVRHLDVGAGEYASFLAPWYAAGRVASLAGLEAAVGEGAPERVAELRAVMRTHLAAGVRS
ncbi:hypothetical protein ACOCJ7_14025 [Knoellia sp. CPCC 206453]|uniref:hypothetical protein n=1 Tax=Knoellia pratensis TaxID=3404796 RepID=UPI00361221C8